MIQRWVGAGVLAVLVAVSGCGSERKAETAPLVGAWRSSIRFESGSFASIQDLEFLYAFHADGTMTESSNYDAAPPVPPAYGVWRASGAGEFEAKYEFFVTTPAAPDAFKSGAGWNPSGRGVLTERIEVAEGGDAFTSTLTLELFDREGKPVEGGGKATGHGARIRF